jgi:NAD(P)-dependent dehydrogenase (short-subunit alcohol dehydrogenase family)
MTIQTQALGNRVAIVTGGGAGIGRGVALALADRGASVVVMGRRLGPLEEVQTEIRARGGQALVVQGDVGRLDDVERCIAGSIDEFGRLDILINNAQAYRHAFLLDATEDDMQLTWESGPLAAFRFMRLAHPYLARNGGVIVNFGSGTQLDPTERFHGVYVAAKGAIEGLTRVAAVEWGGDGIRVLMVMPAAETEGVAAFRDRDPKRYEEMVARVPLGRFGDPETDIGGAIAWLVGDEASFITGTTIMLDGGQMYLR